MSTVDAIRRHRPPTTTSTTQGAPLVQTLRDTWLIYRRSLVLTLRQPVWVGDGHLPADPLPRPVRAAARRRDRRGRRRAPTPTTGSSPGLLVQTAMFAAAFAGFGLVAELRYGVVERMRVTPMSRFAMLAGRSLRDVTIMLVQAIADDRHRHPVRAASSIPVGARR